MSQLMAKAWLFPRRLMQWSHTFRDLSPSCPATIDTIDYVFARVGRAPLQVLPSSNAPALSYKVKNILRRGNIHPILFGKLTKIGYTRVVSEQNRVPFFSRRGALTHVCKTPPKRVLAPEPTTPCARAAPQTVFSVFDPSKQRQ